MKPKWYALPDKHFEKDKAWENSERHQDASNAERTLIFLSTACLTMKSKWFLLAAWHRKDLNVYRIHKIASSFFFIYKPYFEVFTEFCRVPRNIFHKRLIAGKLAFFNERLLIKYLNFQPLQHHKTTHEGAWPRSSPPIPTTQMYRA